MGQKINPTSFRIGTTKTWQSRWFFSAKGGQTGSGMYPYARFLAEDEAIRGVINERIKAAGIAAIEIERTSNNIRVLIKAARPGLIIGQGGKGIEELTRAITARLNRVRGAGVKGARMVSLSVNVEELKRSEISAAHVAQLAAWDIEKRLPFRRTMKKHLDQSMQNKAVKGAKIMMAGRLGGAEIARREVLRQGALPLQSLRADIDYGKATAYTTYGTIGVTVWLYKGDIFERRETKKQ